MPIRYRNLGEHRRLSSIVFAGSHDASITGGAANARTQDLDIAGQAAAGVRLFDLRILMEGNSQDGFSLVGYHGASKKSHSANVTSTHVPREHSVKYTKGMLTGTTGLKLSDMLKNARDFVGATGEFLILKFDKCKNYELIANYCVEILGDAIYTANYGVELGEKSISQLGGKVICVFPDSALLEIRGLDQRSGILGFRNLKGKDSIKAYEPRYSGLQYFGKGGTSPFKFWKSHKKKIKENEKKQAKLMAKMSVSDSENAEKVLGMMYWTTTGLKESIEDRNNTMWQSNHGLYKLWAGGLESSIEHQLRAEEITYVNDPKLGSRMRAFFPNIVMIDFADPEKCKTIYDLNLIAENRLVQAFGQYV